MTRFTSVVPNLLVRDVAASTAFYRDVLGFTMGETVPDKAPFVFVWMKRDDVSVFLNDITAAAHDYPDALKLPPGGTAALFFIIAGVDAYHAQVAPNATVIMPLKTQFYGMREFAVTDPDGHIITFAERVGNGDEQVTGNEKE
jgi:catechol 2,3-dioxygenase-like lactoylglutathione lyase family enzyme